MKHRSACVFTAFLIAFSLAAGITSVSAEDSTSGLERHYLKDTSEISDGAAENIHYTAEQIISRTLEASNAAKTVTDMESVRIWVLSSVSDPSVNRVYDIYKVDFGADIELYMGAFFENVSAAVDNPDRIFADSAVSVGNQTVLSIGDTDYSLPGYEDVKSAKSALIDSAGADWDYSWRKPDGSVSGSAQGGAGEKPSARNNSKSQGVMTYKEYMDAPADSSVVIEAYVDEAEEWKDGRTTVTASDGDGTYLIYRLSCSEDEYQKLAKDTRIKVSGYKVERSGVVKITGGALEIEDASAGNASASADDTSGAAPDSQPAPEAAPVEPPAPEPTPTAAPEPVPTAAPTPTPVPAETTMTIYCGIEVPVSEFLFPDNSSRKYTKEEFYSLFSGNARERYFKSQIFIDEIFARYGYRFTPGKKAPGTAMDAKYRDKSWYQTAVAFAPSQNMDTIMFQYLNSTELYNVNLVNEWQVEAGIEPY